VEGRRPAVCSSQIFCGREASHCVPFLSEMFADRRHPDVNIIYE
jgi:hypothetical protein